MQKTGSFKARGALNAVSMLNPVTTSVCCDSSGNHGQAQGCKRDGTVPFIILICVPVPSRTKNILLSRPFYIPGQALSWAAKVNGKACHVAVPEGAPQVKVNAIQNYGGIVHFCPPNDIGRKGKKK